MLRPWRTGDRTELLRTSAGARTRQPSITVPVRPQPRSEPSGASSASVHSRSLAASREKHHSDCGESSDPRSHRQSWRGHSSGSASTAAEHPGRLGRDLRKAAKRRKTGNMNGNPWNPCRLAAPPLPAGTFKIKDPYGPACFKRFRFESIIHEKSPGETFWEQQTGLMTFPIPDWKEFHRRPGPG